MKPDIVIGIETAVSGGSVSIIESGAEVGFWLGEKRVSRAEDLLSEISSLITKTGIKKRDIQLIAVSNQFGSHTGLRIGVATAYGLSRALNCEIVETSVLQSIARSGAPGNVLSAISGYKNDVFCEYFSNGPKGEFATVSEAENLSLEDFIKSIAENVPDSILVNQRLFTFLNSSGFQNEKLVDIGGNLAKFIGLNARLTSGISKFPETS